MLQKLQERVELLTKELQTANDKFEQAKTIVNQLTGHYNESIHLLNELKKEGENNVGKVHSESD